MKKKNSLFIPGVILLMIGAVYAGSLNPEEAYNLIGKPVSWLVIISAVFLIISVFAIFKAMDTMRQMILNKDGKLTESEEEENENSDFLSRIWEKLQDSKPVEEEAEIELDHNYDGIRELDNNLPPWWLWGFYLSIVFAVIYLVRYHVTGSAPLSDEEYKIELAEAKKAKEEYLKNAANLVDESNVLMLTEAVQLNEGSKIYKSKCAVCHGADGGGTVGPNLTDEYWLHGGDIKSIFSTIKYGVPAKGMVPWKDQIGPADMQKVASFIMSLKGSTPANPKDPQGELYTPKAKVPDTAIDSTTTNQ